MCPLWPLHFSKSYSGVYYTPEIGLVIKAIQTYWTMSIWRAGHWSLCLEYVQSSEDAQQILLNEWMRKKWRDEHYSSLWSYSLVFSCGWFMGTASKLWAQNSEIWIKISALPLSGHIKYYKLQFLQHWGIYLIGLLGEVFNEVMDIILLLVTSVQEIRASSSVCVRRAGHPSITTADLLFNWLSVNPSWGLIG